MQSATLGRQLHSPAIQWRTMACTRPLESGKVTYCAHKLSPCHSAAHNGALRAMRQERPGSKSLTNRSRTNPLAPSSRCQTSSSSAASADDGQPPRLALASVAAAVQKFVSDQFLPCMLLAALLVGYLLPATGVAAANLNVSFYTTFGIFILQGATRMVGLLAS